MNNGLNALEEFDAQRKIQFPHLLKKASDIIVKKNIALLVFGLKEWDVLLISPSGFSESSVIAGITEKNIEFFLKKAPMEYKKNLLEAIENEFIVEETVKIAEAMDEDMSTENSNQNRVRNVLNYIRDNSNVLSF